MAESLGRTFIKTLQHDSYAAIDAAQWVVSGDYAGRVVLITGASRGFGRAMTLSYARGGLSGFILVARSSSSLDAVEKEARAVHPTGVLKVLKLSIDVADEISVSEAARAAKGVFDRLDVLVSRNAGSLENYKSVDESDPITWWLTLGGQCKMNIGKLAVLRFTEFLISSIAHRVSSLFSLDPGGVLTDMVLLYLRNFMATSSTRPSSQPTLVWWNRDRKEWLAG